MRPVYLFLAAALAVSSPSLSYAQFDSSGRKLDVAPEPVAMTLEQILPEVNKGSVINGGKYASAKAVLSRRIRDADQKLVGEIKDINVGAGGSVDMVAASFAKLHLNGTVALDLQADGMKGVNDGYVMGLGAADIKSAFPELITRTKQFAQDPKGVSVKKLVGADVVSSGGEDVGKLKEILFDSKAEHADLAFLIVNYGPLKNKAVVVPFGIIDIQTKRDRPVLVIANEDLETVFKYLSQKGKQ